MLECREYDTKYLSSGFTNTDVDGMTAMFAVYENFGCRKNEAE
jgi:hypothetical protein